MKSGNILLYNEVPPVEERMTLTDTFSFSCGPHLPCFNTCCHSKHLPLTPYDILRLKQNLDFHSDKFLETYAVYGLDPETGFPIVSLNMAGNPERRCPFVRDDGCGVYPDRPMACRLFPLGRASGMSPDGRSSEEFFFTLKVTGCMGTEQGNVQSVREWRDDQGLLPYTEMNDRMLGLVFHPRRDCQRPLSEPQLQKIMVACYNLDVFREFVFEAGFADRWGIDSATCSKIRTDDTALLKLGFRYLKQTLYD